MSKGLGSIDANTNTFLDLWTKVQALLSFANTEVVTVNSAGATTTGNGFISGTFGANVFYTPTLRGGTLAANGTINVQTNAVFSSNVTFAGDTVLFNSSVINVNSNTTFNGSLTATNVTSNSVTAARLTIGNTTSNVFANSTTVSIGTFYANSGSFGFGSTVRVTPISLGFGNLVANIVANTTTIVLGPSIAWYSNGLVTSNVSMSASFSHVGNSTTFVSINPTSISVSNAAVINTTSVRVGANVLMTDSNISIGNSTVNTSINATSFVGTATNAGLLDNKPPSFYTPRYTRVRQTVYSGPANNGVQSFLPATSANLSITSVGITANTPLLVTAASGFDQYGEVNYFGATSNNLTWSAFGTNRVNYLYVIVDPVTGALTPGRVISEPIYKHSGSPSINTGQYTFIISEMKGYLANGNVADPKLMVFVGEVTTNATGVTSTTEYAYNGYYESDWVTPLSNAYTAVSLNSDLGIPASEPLMMCRFLVAEAGYSAKDVFIPMTGVYSRHTFTTTRNTIGFNMISNGTWVIVHKTTGADVNITNSSVEYKLIHRRTW